MFHQHGLQRQEGWISKGDCVRDGMEAIMRRRSTAITIGLGEATQLVICANTSIKHNPAALKPLLKELSGTIDCSPPTPNLVPSEPVQFEKRVLKVDVEKIHEVKSMLDSTTSTVYGLAFWTLQEMSLGAPSSSKGSHFIVYL